MAADLEVLSGNTLKTAECDEPAAPGCSPVHISSKDTLRTSPPPREILLPTEIITQILTYIPSRPASQSTFHALCLVSRAWYTAAISSLYIRPYITPNNFSQFVTTVCPSKNAHILPSPLSVLVRSLDMGELVHNSSKSLTARLLGRLKGNLEQFVAPQASFAINSFAALSKCTSLTHLDLSLLSASISNKMLFQSLAHLTHLETLLFPRSSALDQNIDTLPYTWPPKLRALHLAGGISDDFLLTHMSTLPLTLQKISIQHCSSVHTHAITYVLETLGPQLTHLTIRHPMRHLFPGSLDTLLTFCPSLLALRISADFISPALFTPAAIPPNHSLRILDLECSTDPTADVDIQADSVYEAAENGLLPDLRRVCVSARLAWGASEKTRRDAADLLEVMEERESERPLGIAPEVLYWMSDTI